MWYLKITYESFRNHINFRNIKISLNPLQIKFILLYMYHPGKVSEVFSPKSKQVDSADGVVQAMLEMWDENVITVLVEKKLVSTLRKDDVVLVDYTTPKLKVVKILRDDVAKSTWKKYRDQFAKRKIEAVAMQSKLQAAQHESYVG